MKSYKNIMLATICLTKAIQTSEVVDALELASLLPEKKSTSEKSKKHVHDYVEKFREKQAEKKQQRTKDAIHYIKQQVRLDENDNIKFPDINHHAIMNALDALPMDMLINLGHGIRWEVREIKEALDKITEDIYPSVKNFDNPKSEFLTRAEIDRAEEAVRAEIVKAQAAAHAEIDKAQANAHKEATRREAAARKIQEAYRSKHQVYSKKEIKDDLQNKIYLKNDGTISIYHPKDLEQILRDLNTKLSKFDTLNLSSYDDKLNKQFTAQEVYLSLLSDEDADLD